MRRPLRFSDVRADALAVADSTNDEILTARFNRMGVCPTVTRRLKTDDFSQVLTVVATVAAVTAAVEQVTAQVGQVLDSAEDTLAIVKTGFLRMNPAVLRIRCTDRGGGITSVDVHASAKEGLISQHGGRQAVREFVARLESLEPTVSMA
jgi:hypothetical protein